MIKVRTKKHLDALTGKAQPAAPAPAPPAADPLSGMQAAMAQLAGQVEQAVKVMAEAKAQQAASKKLEAVIHRDANGRMDRVTINVIK